MDTLGPDGPAIYPDELLAQIDEMVTAGTSPSVVVRAIQTATLRSLWAGDLPGFWEGWEESGVDVTSLTLGGFGEDPFTFENAIYDLGLWTRTFDVVNRFVKVMNAADARRAKAEGKKAVILNFQNTTHFGDDLDNVDLFYDFGLRIVQLTYNQHNLVGDGCTELNPAGLSKFGRAVVDRFNDLGILVDTSHCSEPTTLDAIETSEVPVAVTHAFARSIFAHDRGKSDDVIRAIGESGGYFGILCAPFFITDDPSPNLDHFIAHFEHVIDLIGPEHVGIGTDWGTELPSSLIGAMNEEMARFGFRAEHRIDWGATLGGYETWQQWPNITRALVARGYSDEQIAGFLGGNFLRVFQEVVG